MYCHVYTYMGACFYRKTTCQQKNSKGQPVLQPKTDPALLHGAQQGWLVGRVGGRGKGEGKSYNYKPALPLKCHTHMPHGWHTHMPLQKACVQRRAAVSKAHAMFCVEGRWKGSRRCMCVPPPWFMHVTCPLSASLGKGRWHGNSLAQKHRQEAAQNVWSLFLSCAHVQEDRYIEEKFVQQQSHKKGRTAKRRHLIL